MSLIATRKACASLLFSLYAALLLAAAPARSEMAVQPDGAPTRILHVMSYHAPWRWTEGQMEGFKVGLGDTPMWRPVVERMKATQLPPDVGIVAWDTISTFDE